jgi:hypothetical protein
MAALTLGVVMLKLRNHECQQYATVKSIALEGLSKEEAQALLLKAARVPQDQYSIHEEDAVMVASLLQSHPLALIQAGAYVSRGHCSLAEYPGVFAQQRQRLLAFRPAQAPLGFWIAVMIDVVACLRQTEADFKNR